MRGKGGVIVVVDVVGVSYHHRSPLVCFRPCGERRKRTYCLSRFRTRLPDTFHAVRDNRLINAALN